VAAAVSNARIWASRVRALDLMASGAAKISGCRHSASIRANFGEITRVRYEPDLLDVGHGKVLTAIGGRQPKARPPLT